MGSGTGKQFLAVNTSLMTQCGLHLASRPQPQPVKVGTHTHTRTTAAKEIHFNCTLVSSLTNAKLLLVRNTKAKNEKSK